MYEEALDQLMPLMHQICDSMDDLMKRQSPEAKLPDMTAWKALNLELYAFMLYLSTSDGEPDEAEAALVSRYLHKNISAEDMKSVDRNSLPIDRPIMLQAFVLADNVIYAQNGKQNRTGCVSLYAVFGMFGQEVMLADGNISLEEVRDYNEYMDMQRKYILENLEVLKEDPGAFDRELSEMNFSRYMLPFSLISGNDSGAEDPGPDGAGNGASGNRSGTDGESSFGDMTEHSMKSVGTDLFGGGAGGNAGGRGAGNGTGETGASAGSDSISDSPHSAVSGPGSASGAAGKTDQADAGKKEEEPEKTLEELLGELDELTGLETVKRDVHSLIHLMQIRKIREERGMKQMSMSLHMVFTGNPGTGKTTVARLLAKIYRKLGVLSKGQLVETDRSGLVAGYVGQTAIKVQDMIQKSLGGILFIDEAYSLTSHGGENDYGSEAVDTLLKGMEDHRDDFIVIVAGYPDLMREFVDSNPGLRSRFNKYIEFPDYTPDELVAIFDGMCRKSGYQPDEEGRKYVKKYFTERYENRDRNFANAREVRNFFEKAVVRQADRLAGDKDITDEDLKSLVLADLKPLTAE